MKLFTIDETISSILEETEGLDEEITDGIILRKKEISAIEIEKLKSKLEIEYLDSVFTEDILSYNWGNLGFLSYQFGYGDETSLSWLINRNLRIRGLSGTTQKRLNYNCKWRSIYNFIRMQVRKNIRIYK